MNPTQIPSQAPSPPARETFEIRPGVTFPDWERITSPAAEAALRTIFRAVGVERRWTGYSPDLDAVRTAILRRFAASGRAPSMAELSAATGLPDEQLRAILRELRSRDLVVLADDGERITGAYPFTEQPTGYSVRHDAGSATAMCAVDALGIGAMLRSATTVVSSCRLCRAAVRVETEDRGSSLKSADPEGSVVWVGADYSGNCGATSLCTTIAFFCSNEHLHTWRSAALSSRRGLRLALEEAHQLGSAIFAPILRFNA